MSKNKFSALQKQLANTNTVIFFDIETSPMLAYVWGPGKQYIQHSQLVPGTETRVITIQWMFEGDKEVSYLHWDKDQNDGPMLEEFSKLFSGAKIAVSQNGKAFDHKVLQWRLNVLGLTPLKNVVIFDTLQLSRQNFRCPSHSLDYVSKALLGTGKHKVDFSTWIDVLWEKKGALEEMIKYGCKDVILLRKLFWRSLPYYKDLPASLSQVIYGERERCIKCASKHQRRFDIYPTKVQNKQMWQCNNCGYVWKDTRIIK